MPLPSQLKKLETILHIYAAGDAHLVEGLKLTFMALVSPSVSFQLCQRFQKKKKKGKEEKGGKGSIIVALIIQHTH